MTTEDRVATIKKLIVENSYLSLSELSRQLNVSESTARRDLQALERQGVLTRNHGGAVINEAYKQKVQRGFHLEAPIKITNQREKEAVGIEAAKLVADGEFIAIGSGTTCLEFARCLKDKRDLTILTNNVLVALEMSCYPSFQVLLAGGVSIFENNCVNTMEIEEDTFGSANFRASKIFCSVLGIDFSMGYTDINIIFLRTWKRMLQRADKSILLTTHEKFDKRGFVTIAGLDSVNEVVTTAKIPSAYRAYYEKRHIAVHIAE